MTEQAIAARRKYQHEWRDKNRERVRAYSRKWHAENRERFKEYTEKYWEKKALQIGQKNKKRRIGQENKKTEGD